jgi:hypothetical protein
MYIVSGWTYVCQFGGVMCVEGREMRVRGRDEREIRRGEDSFIASAVSD